MRWPLAQEQEESRLAEPFDARAHAPLAGPHHAAASSAAAGSRPHFRPICKTHM
jgi:hypothetical protein